MKKKTTFEFKKEDIVLMLERKHNVKLKNVKMSPFGIKAEVEENEN